MSDREHMHANILVLDSGVGGLSICQALLEKNANIRLRYIADDAEFPYGVKDDEFLVDRLQKLIHASSRQYHFDMIIVACNTASTLVLPALRKQVDVPVVGVVPAIKPAAMLSTSKTIGLLATPGTIKRGYTQQLIDDFASDCRILKIGTRVLVEQAENLLMHGCVDEVRLAQELSAWESEGELDAVVLGCTHFPLLKVYLAKLFPNVQWVDSATAIARRVESLLAEGGMHSLQGALAAKYQHDLAQQIEERIHDVMFTRAVPESQQFIGALRGLGMDRVLLSKLEL